MSTDETNAQSALVTGQDQENGELSIRVVPTCAWVDPANGSLTSKETQNAQKPQKDAETAKAVVVFCVLLRLSARSASPCY